VCVFLCFCLGLCGVVVFFLVYGQRREWDNFHQQSLCVGFLSLPPSDDLRKSSILLVSFESLPRKNEKKKIREKGKRKYPPLNLIFVFGFSLGCKSEKKAEEKRKTSWDFSCFFFHAQFQFLAQNKFGFFFFTHSFWIPPEKGGGVFWGGMVGNQKRWGGKKKSELYAEQRNTSVLVPSCTKRRWGDRPWKGLTPLQEGTGLGSVERPPKSKNQKKNKKQNKSGGCCCCCFFFCFF